jgi:hypothetical protein
MHSLNCPYHASHQLPIPCIPSTAHTIHSLKCPCNAFPQPSAPCCGGCRVVSQNDKDKLAEAKDICYKKGFYEGIMKCGTQKGTKVEKVGVCGCVCVGMGVGVGVGVGVCTGWRGRGGPHAAFDSTALRHCRPYFAKNRSLSGSRCRPYSWDPGACRQPLVMPSDVSRWLCRVTSASGYVE